MDELIEKLTYLGQIVTIKNGYVFTLLLRTSKADKIVLDVLGHVTSAIKDKNNVEVIQNDGDFILIILKP